MTQLNRPGRSRWRICFALLLAAGALIACADEGGQGNNETRETDNSEDGAQGTASAACLDSMSEAAAEPDSTAAEPLIVATLDACETPDEWFEALREHPAAMGLKDASFVSELDLEVACDGNEQTAVCSER